MRRLLATTGLALAALASVIVAPPASAALEAVPVGEFTRPTFVTGAPGVDDLLFVVERGGRIRILQDGVPLPDAFLDISDIVFASLEDPGAEAEQGLLSVAFAPDYESSGLFYVYFTNNDGDIEIDEFSRTGGTDTVADPASRRQVIVIPHRERQNHNGGQLQFGGGGNLYFATGDGGGGQRANAPDLDSLLGKLLRIDPRPHAGMPYRVPGSNPYVGAPGRDEIVAYGLRNPWRFSFDRARIVIADVGFRTTEEVNVLRTRDVFGVNFGWPAYEGNDPFDGTLPGPDPVTFPAHTYSHDGDACAVTGGYVIHDETLGPQLHGRYIYSDFCTGQIRTFRPASDEETGTFTARHDKPAGITAPGLTTFGRDNAGQIYFAQLDGHVFRLAAAP